MKKFFSFAARHLSASIFVAIYIVLIPVYLILEGFVPETQLNLLTLIVPFAVLGVVLDYIAENNKALDKNFKILARLLPAGVFLLFGITALLKAIGRETSDLFNYLMWLFITAPFFIASYNKERHKDRLTWSLIGTALVGGAYLYLTTKSLDLNRDSGLVIFLISYFLAFYAASNLKRLPWLSTVIGAINAAYLLLIYLYPNLDFNNLRQPYSDLALSFELLMMEFIILCILICLLSTIQNKRQECKSK